MNRVERRRFEKEFLRLLKKTGGVCGLCGEALTHNSQTFGGTTLDNRVVLTGECCSHKLQMVMGTGVYINKNIDVTLSVLGTSRSDLHVSPSEAFSTVRHMRTDINTLDNAAIELMRRGGLHKPPTNVSFADSPWKLDDAAWFKTHPNRSHRLRPMCPGEAASLSPQLMQIEIPENHRWEILVRQVKKGQRIRTVFLRNTQACIPDADEVIHAIFDLVCEPGRSGKINNEEVAALAEMFHIYRDAPLN
jgi:hypothetical protein